VGDEVSTSAVMRHPSRGVWFSAVTAILTAALPKCPLCWMTLTGALGVGSLVPSRWMRPVAVAILLLPVTMLFVRARRLRVYGPFALGLAAAAVMYLCKFSLNYAPGVYLSGATLLGASIWNAVSRRRAMGNVRCRC
jgi:hypothetical protein